MSANRISNLALFWLILLLPTIYILSQRNAVKTNGNGLKTDTVVVYVDRCVENVDWDAFIEALIWVESNNNPNAAGKANDVGVLQITPIIVEECNRLLGDSVYSLEDRYDRQKSIEMFNVIQNKYNPDKCPHWALKLWNPKSSYDYHIKVFAMYKEITN